MPAARLTLLGGFGGRLSSGSALALPTRKAEALLAFLAQPTGQAHPRDKLAALLWDELPRPDARARLRQALFAIRSALDGPDPPALRLENDTVGLDPQAITVDVADFERLAACADPDSWRAAVALYHGDLLAGIAPRETPFESWLMTERERLHERALETVAKLLDAERRRGDAEAAIQAALKLLSLDPLQEVAHRALMRLYAATNRRAAALRQYRICVDTFQRELGLEPEAETQDLYQEILQQRLPGGPATRSAARPPGGAPAGLSSETTAMIGRADELAQFRRTIGEIGKGASRVIAVIGEAGVGKTRLVMEAASVAAASGVRVVLGRSHESQQILPFGPWADAFRSSMTAEDVEEFDALRPVWRAALSDLVYGLDATDTSAGARPHFVQVFEAVAGLLRRLVSKQPLMLVFEDAQWADELSIRLLAFVARISEGWPLGIVATVRAEELADAPVLRRALDELDGTATLTRMVLSPLSRDETVALARVIDEAIAGSRAEQIWLTSEGNALVAVEVIRALRQGLQLDASGHRSLPERVRRLIEQRLDRLTDDAQELVAIAATVGREFLFPLLERASDLGETGSARALEELVRRRILHEVGESFAFTHERIRDVAYARLLGPRRRLLHRRVGEALERSRRVERHYGSLGVHFEHAEIWDKAVDYLSRAGRTAYERGAMRDAVALFERALAAVANIAESPAAITTEIDLRLALHRALVPLGEVGATQAHLRRAEAVVGSIADRRREGLVVVSMAEYCGMSGDHARAARFSERALEIATEIGDAALADEAHFRFGASFMYLGDPHRAIGHFTATLAGLERQPHPDRVGYPYLPALRRCADQLALIGHVVEAQAYADRAAGIAGVRDDPWSLAEGNLALGLVSLEGHTADRAIPVLARALECARSAELGLLEPQIAAALAVAQARAGSRDEALAAIEVASQMEATTAVMNMRARRLAYLAEACMRVGARNRAERLAEQALSRAREGEAAHEPQALCVFAELARRQDPPDTKAAERHYREALERADRLGLAPVAAGCRAALSALARSA